MDRLALSVWILLAIGCTSPEAERSRGGSRGADLGNRGEAVVMHEGSKPFYGTPKLQPTDPPPLEGASHAHALSVER